MKWDGVGHELVYKYNKILTRDTEFGSSWSFFWTLVVGVGLDLAEEEEVVVVVGIVVV